MGVVSKTAARIAIDVNGPGRRIQASISRQHLPFGYCFLGVFVDFFILSVASAEENCFIVGLNVTA